LLAISATGITLLFVMMHRLSGPARELGRKMKKEHEKLAERMLVTLHGMRALRAFAQESHYQQGFERASAEVRRTSLTFERLYALVSPAVQLGYLLLLAVTVFAGQLLVPHRLRRPAGHETRGRLMVASPSATGTEVGCSMVRESPSVSRTRNAGAPRSAPWAGDGSGARFLEFF
jgi:ABC-type multidrug transport system fused ATPase/permease subunit